MTTRMQRVTSEPAPHATLSRVRDNGGVSEQPEQPAPNDPVETVETVETVESTETVGTVTVRRAPKLYRFMAVGAVVGVLITLILVLAFPEQDDFSPLQVLGFTGIFLVAICVALGALVALVLDRASRKRSRTVRAERIEEREVILAEPLDEAIVPAETSAPVSPAAVEKDDEKKA